MLVYVPPCFQLMVCILNVFFHLNIISLLIKKKSHVPLVRCSWREAKTWFILWLICLTWLTFSCYMDTYVETVQLTNFYSEWNVMHCWIMHWNDNYISCSINLLVRITPKELKFARLRYKDDVKLWERLITLRPYLFGRIYAMNSWWLEFLPEGIGRWQEFLYLNGYFGGILKSEAPFSMAEFEEFWNLKS